MTSVIAAGGRLGWPVTVSRVTLPQRGECVRVRVSARRYLDINLASVPELCDLMIDLAETT